MLIRFSRWAAMTLAILVMAGSAPGLVPAAHADSLAWARRLVRDFRAAQKITKGKGVTIAVLSSGVDGRVPSLRGSVLRGRDFVRTPRPKKIFGTLVASLIAGSGPTHDSPFGMRGLAPGVKILPVRVWPDRQDPGVERWFDVADTGLILAKGIRYAADQGADVICVAPYVYWGGADGYLKAAVAYALSKNAVVVAGNARVGYVDSYDQSDAPYPATASGVIGVAPVTEKGKRYRRYSSKGSGVLVAAPGSELPSIGPGNSLWTFWGSAPAAGWVAAAAALVRSEYPRLSPGQVAQAITRSAHHPEGGFNTELGFGIVNPMGALREARALETHPPATVATKDVMAVKEHFGGEPETIGAVRHNPWLITGLSVLVAAGVVLLAFAFMLLRGRRRAALPVIGTAQASAVPASPAPVVPRGMPEPATVDPKEQPPEDEVRSGGDGKAAPDPGGTGGA